MTQGQRTRGAGQASSRKRTDAPVATRAGSGKPAKTAQHRQRVCVQGLDPEIDAGRYPVKRVVGESVTVEADVFTDGHDSVACVLRYRPETEAEWAEVPMEPLGNDRWRGSFVVTALGRVRYTVEGWVDPFTTWQHDLAKRVAAETDTVVDYQIGQQLIDAAATRATGGDRQRLSDWAAAIGSERDIERLRAIATEPALAYLARQHPDRSLATRYSRELAVVVERARAGYGAWYELFPRSCASEPGKHGTLRDCLARLDYVAGMHFDVVYLPPIHPIGTTFRKGKNNSTTAEPDDVGSPWAIGGPDGGHTAIHPALGDMADFAALVARARQLGMEVAMDVAFQCSPDHPWVTEHPSWFRQRPDGTIQYAENPPKKYQDIYPIDFSSSDWQALWMALRDVFLFWAQHDVRVFRVDNPHTKPFRFWEWVIAEVRSRYPDTVFLSEAFTRPKVMYELAKAGFSQSYTYFTWRNTKAELTDYLTELTRTSVQEYFRPNLWPNTPDILPEHLQYNGRPAFLVRFVLAATLGANYGIYGPAYELCENVPREPGSEEYRDSEKYELKHRNLDDPSSLREIITLVNRARRDNPALQANASLRFHAVDNDMLLCFSKTSPDRTNAIVVVVNLDFTYRQTGWVTLDLEALGLTSDQAYQVHDLLGGARYLWQGPRNYVELHPQDVPAHIFRVRRKTRTERDFDYFL